jgi:hypothetical protein
MQPPAQPASFESLFQPLVVLLIMLLGLALVVFGPKGPAKLLGCLLAPVFFWSSWLWGWPFWLWSPSHSCRHFAAP